MMTDFWAHEYFDNPKAAEEVEDDDFDLQAELEKLENDPNAWETLSRHDDQNPR